MIPAPEPRFAQARHREAAAVLCGTVTGSFGRQDVEALAEQLLDGIEGDERCPDERLTAVEVACGAAFVISKLVSDTETVFGVPARQTLARLGLWVATDELSGGAS